MGAVPRRCPVVLGSIVPVVVILVGLYAVGTAAPTTSSAFVTTMYHNPRSKALSASRKTAVTTKTMTWWREGNARSKSGLSNALGSSAFTTPRQRQLLVASSRSSSWRGVCLYAGIPDGNDDASFRPKNLPPFRSLLDKILFVPKYCVWQVFRVLAYVHRAVFRLFVQGVAATMTAIIIDPAVNKALANAVKDGLNLWITQPQFKEKLLRFQRNLSVYEGREGEPSSLARPIGQDFPKVVLDFIIGLLSLPDLGNNGTVDNDDEKGNSATPFKETTLSASSRRGEVDGEEEEGDDGDDKY